MNYQINFDTSILSLKENQMKRNETELFFSKTIFSNKNYLINYNNNNNL